MFRERDLKCTDDLQCRSRFFLALLITAGEDITKPVAYCFSEAGFLIVHNGDKEPVTALQWRWKREGRVELSEGAVVALI